MSLNKLKSFKFTSIYLLLCAASLAFIPISSAVTGGQMELAGILFALLGLPWSLIFIIAAVFINVSSAWIFAAGLILSCAINAVLIYKKESKSS